MIWMLYNEDEASSGEINVRGVEENLFSIINSSDGQLKFELIVCLLTMISILRASSAVSGITLSLSESQKFNEL